MVDSVQVILLIVIVVLTVLLVVLGIQVFFILRDLRETISKTNRVLDNADAITENIEGPLSMLSSLATGLKGSSALMVINFIKTLLGRESDGRKHRD